jgi:hypothetical protein
MTNVALGEGIEKRKETEEGEGRRRRRDGGEWKWWEERWRVGGRGMRGEERQEKEEVCLNVC